VSNVCIFVKMETVHTREFDSANEVVLENKPVIVEKAHIIGLERTKADFIQDELRPLLKCKSFFDAYEVALQCRDGLMSKGIFQAIDVYLDTTEAYEQNLHNGIQVLFKVAEHRLVNGEASTEISSQDRPRWVLRGFIPNLFGRGEVLSASVSHTFGNNAVSQAYLPTDFTTSFTKPLKDGSNVRFSILKEILENPWSCCREITKGLQFGYNFPFKGNKHTIEWLGHWRELCCTTGSNATLEVRRQYGDTLKSSLKHTVVIDKNDTPILPKEGQYFRISEELAGFGGDVKFIKQVFEGTMHSTFNDKFTFGLGAQAGLLIPFGSQVSKLQINDKFFIGGPLTLRGFKMNRVGNGSVGTFLGSNCFWMIGGHVYAPLPYAVEQFGQGTWVDNFRLHGFFNAGNAFDVDPDDSVSHCAHSILDKTRVSCGCGLVYKLMDWARIELNFCVPLLAQETDFTSPGLQFGIGISSV